jgi:hypothetical protein
MSDQLNKLKQAAHKLLVEIDLATDCMSNQIKRERIDHQLEVLEHILGKDIEPAKPATNVTLDHVSRAVRSSDFVMESQGYQPSIEETIEIAVKKIGIAAMAAPVRLDIGNGSFLVIELEVAQ